MDAVSTLIKALAQEALLEDVSVLRSLETRPECPILALSHLGLIDEQDALAAISKYLDIPVMNLLQPQIRQKLRIAEYSKIVDQNLCWKHKVVPLYEEDEKLIVAFANPFDHDAREAIHFALEKPVSVAIASETDIIILLNQYFSSTRVQYDELNSVETEEYVEIIGALSRDENLGVDDADAPPVVQLGNKILADAVKERASDVHLEPTEFSLEVRFRIDGVMHTILEIPKRLQPYLISRFKLVSGMDIAEKRKPQDGRFRARLMGTSVDVRVSSVPASYGEKVVLRLLHSLGQDLSLQAIGLSESLEAQIRNLLIRKDRMLLVTGPTGSGKTTTLYSCLKEIDDHTRNIQTVEDPIEYRIPGINQIQVNESVGVTFVSALRSILRQDPDIIMIGEIRDTETASIALQAAQTGHLVLSTLHTNDAPSAVTRLLNLEVEPFLIGSSLGGVLAQRLVRRLCENCATPAPEEYLEKHLDLIDQFDLKMESLRISHGCEECRRTGYLRRVGLFSYLEISPTISDLIYESSHQSKIVHSAKEEGFLDLCDAAVEILNKGLTTLDEVGAYLRSYEHADPEKRPQERESSVSKQSVPSTPLETHPQETDTTPPQKADSSSEGISKQKIVLIEDDEDVRSILSLLLQKDMYDVIEAENGLIGLEKVYEHNPALVVCDLMMPIMDGKEFLLRMQNHQDTKTIPVVMLTAVDSESNELDLLELGANDFVSKSASSEVFLARLRRAISDL